MSSSGSPSPVSTPVLDAPRFDNTYGHSFSTDDTKVEQQREMSKEDYAKCEVTRLAQQLTRQSTHYSTSASLENPFLDVVEGSTLNPHGDNFKARDWMKNLLALTARDPERFRQRAAGISFKNMSVHGYGSPTDYQKDVFNSVLQIGHLFRLVTGTGKQKIQILRNFDGLVKSGEMLVVLGRPGRYAELPIRVKLEEPC